MNWRALIAVVALGVMIAWAIRSLQGSPEAEFTAQEKAMLEGLEPVLDTLVLQQEDLSPLPGHFEPCEGGDPYGLQYGSQEDSPDLEHIEAVRWPDDAPASYSSFCDADGRAFVSSVVRLPHDKEYLVFLRAAYDAFIRADEDALRELVDASADDLYSAEEVVDYRWVSTPKMGDWRYAWARTVDSPDTDQPLEVYHFKLIRNLVLGGVLVEIPSSPTSEGEARALAQAFDNRIAAQLESLAAEVRAP